jgi:4-hydroxy-tetrahydrodipicolinate synthase
VITDLFVPVLTPFQADGAIDAGALVAHSEWVVGQGATGIMLFGTTGEGPSISVREKVDTARTVTRQLAGVPVIASVTENSLTDILACLRGYNDLDLAGALVLPPSYFREPEPDGLEALLVLACQTSVHPVLAYHIPSMAPAIAPQVVASLPVWGAKDSGGDLAYTQAVLAAGKSIMVGAESTIPAAIRAGANGCIAGMGNLMPAELAQMCHATREGRDAEVTGLLDRVLALQAAVLAAAPGLEWVAAMKQVAQQLHGIDLGAVRLPLRARRDYLTPEVKSRAEPAR